MIESQEISILGNPLAVQWLRPHAIAAEGTGSVPGQGVKIPQAVCLSQNKQTDKKFQLSFKWCDDGNVGNEKDWGLCLSVYARKLLGDKDMFVLSKHIKNMGVSFRILWEA